MIKPKIINGERRCHCGKPVNGDESINLGYRRHDGAWINVVMPHCGNRECMLKARTILKMNIAAIPPYGREDKYFRMAAEKP